MLLAVAALGGALASTAETASLRPDASPGMRRYQPWMHSTDGFKGMPVHRQEAQAASHRELTV